MSFSFGFSGDDIDNDAEDAEHTKQVNDMSKQNIKEPTEIASSYGVPPKKHTLEELVSVREVRLLRRVYCLSQMIQPLLVLPSSLFVTIHFSS
jgi:DNA integrity scanning protein DisA with diadenylate cyclase activity